MRERGTNSQNKSSESTQIATRNDKQTKSKRDNKSLQMHAKYYSFIVYKQEKQSTALNTLAPAVIIQNHHSTHAIQ